MMRTFRGGLLTLPAQVKNFGRPPSQSTPPELSNFGEVELRAVTLANSINPELWG